jgi:hypothetical protein
MSVDELKSINVNDLRDSLSGACFHGEVWVECPYCCKAHEMMGCNDRKDGYYIVKCECGNYFRDK